MMMMSWCSCRYWWWCCCCWWRNYDVAIDVVVAIDDHVAIDGDNDYNDHIIAGGVVGLLLFCFRKYISSRSEAPDSTTDSNNAHGFNHGRCMHALQHTFVLMLLDGMLDGVLNDTLDVVLGGVWGRMLDGIWDVVLEATLESNRGW